MMLYAFQWAKRSAKRRKPLKAFVTYSIEARRASPRRMRYRVFGVVSSTPGSGPPAQRHFRCIAYIEPQEQDALGRWRKLLRLQLVELCLDRWSDSDLSRAC